MTSVKSSFDDDETALVKGNSLSKGSSRRVGDRGICVSGAV